MRGFSFAAEVDHPSGEDEGELAEVFAGGGAFSAKEFDGFDKLDPVAGGRAKGLAHVREEGDGAGSSGLRGGHHEGGEEFGVFLLTQKGAGAGFDVEDEGVEAGGELFGEDAGADEAGVFDGAGEVAEGVEYAVGGDQRGGLADDGTTATHEDGFEFGKGEGGAEAGDGFEFVESPAGVAEGAARDHRDGDAAGRGEWGDEEAGFVADTAGGVLVDCDLAETGGGKLFAGVAHGEGESTDFVE